MESGLEFGTCKQSAAGLRPCKGGPAYWSWATMPTLDLPQLSPICLPVSIAPALIHRDFHFYPP